MAWPDSPLAWHPPHSLVGEVAKPHSLHPPIKGAHCKTRREIIKCCVILWPGLGCPFPARRPGWGPLLALSLHGPVLRGAGVLVSRGFRGVGRRQTRHWVHPLSGDGSFILPGAWAQTWGPLASLSPHPVMGQEVLSALPSKHTRSPTGSPPRLPHLDSKHRPPAARSHLHSSQSALHTQPTGACEVQVDCRSDPVPRLQTLRGSRSEHRPVFSWATGPCFRWPHRLSGLVSPVFSPLLP